MLWNIHGSRKAARDFRDRKVAGIILMGHHSHAAILCNWTRRPATRPVLRHPGMRRFVMDVRGVKERDEEIDIKQRDHPSLDSSRIFRTSCGVTTRSFADRVSNPLRIL